MKNLHLSQSQELVAALPGRGTFLVEGPAGCGKSTAAVHRAAQLQSDGSGEVLLLAGSYGMAKHLQSMLREFTDQIITVLSFRQFVEQELGEARLYNHVIVDNGDELKLELLLALTKSLAPDGSLTVFADPTYYNLYPTPETRTQQMAWNVNIKMTGNLRNTVPIARLVEAVHSKLTEKPTPSAGDRSFAKGMRPTLICFTSAERELHCIANLAHQRRGAHTIGVLVDSQETEDSLEPIMRKLGLSPNRLGLPSTFGKSQEKLFLGTPASARGREFDLVIYTLPQPKANTNSAIETRELYSMNQKADLYTAVSRARSRLFLTYSGEGTSEILPEDKSLYTFASG